MNITTEHGKTLQDAYGDLLRGLGQCPYCHSMSYEKASPVMGLNFLTKEKIIFLYRGG